MDKTKIKNCIALSVGFPLSSIENVKKELSIIRLNYIIVDNLKQKDISVYKVLRSKNYNKFYEECSNKYLILSKIENIKNELLERVNDKNIDSLLRKLLSVIYYDE